MSNIEAAVKKISGKSGAITDADTKITNHFGQFEEAVQSLVRQAMSDTPLLAKLELWAAKLKSQADDISRLAGRNIGEIDQPTPISGPQDTPSPT